uniref:PiggyBac transposable element-derived protein domain-containing protein n=1 Tax=Phytophthora ramorum TaxID=164328 RepID=H3H5R1_PHYRM
MAFQARWRELKKAGWNSKRPTGLSDDFIYLMPGKTNKDVRGVDYFVGENELMHYLDQLDITEFAAEMAATGAANKASTIEHAATPVMESPQSQPQPSVAIETSGPAQTPHSHSKETTFVIHGVSPHDTSYVGGSKAEDSHPSSQELTVSRRNLELDFDEASESNNASGDNGDSDSDSEEDDTVVGCDEETKENPGDATKAEPNRIADTDDPLTFAGFESDAEDDDGDDEDSSVDGFDAGDVQLPVPPGMRFGDNLIEATDGMNNIAAGTVPDDYLKEMGINGWSDLQTHGPQVAREKKHPEFKRQTTERIHTELLKMKAVTPRDLCVFVGLLIARSIAPNKEKLAHHWKATDEGAIPRGCFGQLMVRDRFMHVSRNLHFSCNDDERAAKDRAWKLRPVIDALQDRFTAGFMPPATMAFDEAMLPSRSTFNKMRVYLKDKPHKWGTKLFMLCCSTTAYCIRFFEVYCGKKERGDQGRSTDFKSGPAAVVRNQQHIPGMRLLRWWDTRAVHMLSTGGSVETNRITFMGGVDVHDQLRLQRYSLQLCIKYKKYYKSLFLGLTDLAIINAYIVYNARRAAANLSKAWRDGTLAPAPRRDGKKRMIRARGPAESQVSDMSELEEEKEQASDESTLDSLHQPKRARHATEQETTD